MTRLDDLPRPNSPQGAPGYNGGNPGIAAEDRPTERREDFEDELFWHRPSIGQSPEGRQLQRQGQQVNVGDGERAVSVAAGAIIGLLGLSRGSLPGLLGAAVGGAMVYRGVTGNMPDVPGDGPRHDRARPRPGRGLGKPAQRRPHHDRLRHPQVAGGALRLLAQLREPPAHHDAPGVRARDRRPPVALGRQGQQPRRQALRVGRGDHRRRAQPPHRLAIPPRRRRGERRPDHLLARAQRGPRHRGARPHGLRPAAGASGT